MLTFLSLVLVSAADAACVGGPGLLVSEILPDAPGADAGQEFVELVNFLDVDRDVGGWVVEAGTSDYTEALVLPAGLVVPARGVALLAQFSGGDLIYDPSDLTLGNAGSSSDAVRLVDCAGAVIDTLVYGPPGDVNADGWTDDQGHLAVPAVRPGPGEALGRVTLGVDEDDPERDLAVYAVPTPGEVNPFHLALDPLVAGETAGVVVRGALPGAVVHLAGGLAAGPGPCPPALDGACLGIADPRVLGAERSGIDRAARFEIRVPTGFVGEEVLVQAVVPAEAPHLGQVVSGIVDEAAP